MSVQTLKKLGRVIDSKLEKLNKIWETPHMLLSNTEAPDEEAQAQIENFLVSINKVHDELNELVEEQRASTTDVDRFVNECEAIINNSIKPECDALENFLQKHGYTPLQKINLSETPVAESSFLKDEELEQRTQDLSLLDDQIAVQDFDDYIAPVDDDDDDDDDDDEDNQEPADKENADNNAKPSCIPTPVIKRLNPVRNQNSFLTPRSLPQEPIYSPYYHPKK